MRDNQFGNYEDDEDLNQEEGYDDLQDEDVESEESGGGSFRGKAASFLKDPLGTIGRGIGNGIKRATSTTFKKLGELFKALPLKWKIAILLVAVLFVLIVAIILIIADVNSRFAVTTRSKGVKELNITQDSPEASKLALELFNKYDSLIGFNSDQLKTLYENFQKDDSNGNRFLLTSGKKKMGSGGDKFSIDEERSLYEHIQRTEKYNFNQIRWRYYSHTVDDEPLEVEEKSDLELFVPKGIDDDTLATLLKTTAPYLLTQDIPLGVLSGMVGYSGGSSSVEPTVAEKFTYQLIKESLTKMTVNKYDLQTIKIQSSYDDLAYKTYTVEYTVATYENGYQEITSKTTPALESTRTEKTEEKKIDGSEKYSNETFWYVSEAIAYDRVITNTFDHQKYSMSDVNALNSPDSNNLIKTIEVNELYKEDNPYVSLNTNGGIPKDEKGNNKAPTSTETKTYRYTQKEGYTFVYEKEWKDKLTTKESKNEAYSYDTAKEFNTQNYDNYTHMKTDKKLISSDKFEKDNPKDTSIFDSYTKEDTTTKLLGMSIIDLMNSNSGIYGKYLAKNANASEYQGLTRNQLKSSYNQIRNILNSLVKKSASNDDDFDYEIEFNSYTTGHAAEESLPFVYGSSLGYTMTDIAYSGTNSNGYVAGSDLLRMFIHSFEGDGTTSGGGMFDENQQHTTDETKAKYYKVYNAGEEGTVYTVGYGVNITAHFNLVKDAMAECGTPVNSLSDISYGMLIDKAAIDKVEDILLQNFLDTVASETQGLDLQEYQIHALTSRAYVHGSTEYNGTSFKTSYNQYWNEETDDKYEELYEKYKEKQNATSEIVGNVDFRHKLFTEHMCYYVSPSFDSKYPGYETRKKAEFTLFSTGYYSPLQRFYRKGGASPGDVHLIGSDGKVDIAQCLELQTWYEENIFGNAFHAGENIAGGLGSHKYAIDTLPKGQYYSAKTLEAQKKVQGGPHFEFKRVDGDKGIGENGLGIFQCTWWAQSRGTQYLTDNGWTGSYLGDRGALGDGGMVASRVSTQYNVPLNKDINAIRPNSLASYSNGSGTGHVVYIEDVGSDYYVISHCGSGHTWYGVDIVPKGGKVFFNFVGSVCLDDML